MSATITAIPAHPSYHELRGSDGLGLLPTQPPQPRRPAARCFRLDATAHWRLATPSIEPQIRKNDEHTDARGSKA
jgi:hypothetical protein